MCSGGLVSKPRGEPDSKPANTEHFLHYRVIGWELMSCVLGVVVSKPQGDPDSKPARNIHFLHPCFIGLVAHVRCSGGLVPKLQVEPATKPAHNAQFSLLPCQWLETHVMYSMAWCRNHKVTGCQNQLTIYIFSIPVSLASCSCQELWGPGAETTR